MDKSNMYATSGGCQSLHTEQSCTPSTSTNENFLPMEVPITQSHVLNANQIWPGMPSIRPQAFKMTARKASKDFRIQREKQAIASQAHSAAGFSAARPQYSTQISNATNEKETSSLHSSSSLYLQAVSTLGQSPSAYSRINTIINGPPQIQEVNVAPLPAHPHSQAQKFFKSPSTDPQLMELKTVTPSRINNSPRAICSQISEAQVDHSTNPSAQVFRSPPNPFRLKTADGLEIKPTITKTGQGRVSITYPLSMLANCSFGSPLTEDSSASSSEANSTQNCFSQFLNFSVAFNANTPANQISQQTAISPSTLDENKASGAQKDQADADNENRTVPGTPTTEQNPLEGDEEKEDRENVENITKALNIECDVYKETKEVQKKSRQTNRLPKDLRGLMGEANLCFARGDHEDAIKMCMEVIRSAPYCPDAFERLAMIYDEKGERKKALQYSLLAIHLQPGDVDQWVRMAESCEEVGYLEQAIHCYKKASKLNPNDYRLCWAAAVLLQQQGRLRQALEMFKSVVMLLPETEVMQCMALARDIARSCHANNETNLAVEVMEEVLAKHFDHVKYEDVNVMCELAIASRQYHKVFDVMAKHCQLQVKYEPETDPDKELKLIEVEIPDHIPVDLQCKAILTCIYLKSLNLVQTNFEDICSMEPGDIGDLQFDIAEALIEVEDEHLALHVLDILVRSSDYSLAAVWLKKAECHKVLEQNEEEMKSLRRVVSLAPGHTKSYLDLCKVLRQLQKYSEAEEVILDAESYQMEGEEQMLVSYEKYNIYLEWAKANNEKQEKLCRAGDLALLMLSSLLQNAFMVSKTRLLKRQKEEEKQMPYCGELKLVRCIGKNFYKYGNRKYLMAKGKVWAIRNDKWWEMFQESVDILLTTERHSDAITLADSATYYSSWHSVPERRLAMEQMAVSACMAGGNYRLAYTFIRPWLLQDAKCNQLWNIFNQITLRSHEQRHHRFCLRFLIKEPENIALAVLTGHNSLATGSYKHSLGEYMRAHKKLPTEPMYAMLIGVIFTHIATQRFTSHKNHLVTHALAFFNKYLQSRNCDQEAFYNLGRCMHQLGMMHFAVLWYKKALKAEPPKVDMDPSLIDLRQEIAYNLALIYRKSGSMTLANKILEEYCVV